MERCKRLLVDAVAGELKILFDGVADLMGADTEGEVPPELRVSILADACNEIYDGLRNMLLGATLKNDKLSLAVGDEAMGELKLAGRMATGSHAKVECSVQWTAPASTEIMTTAGKAMAAVQAKAIKSLESGDEADAAQQLDQLFAIVTRDQMPLYKQRVEALWADDGRALYEILPAVVRDLLPKFEKIYVATGNGLVRNEPKYGEFSRLEGEVFGEANKAPKPAQPSKTSRTLLENSVKALPIFDKHVVTASNDKTARVWLLADGSLVRTLEGHTGSVMSACVTPDGQHVVTASNDKTARVWLLADGSLVRTLEGHTDGVSSACVTPDGQHVVTASNDKTARVWLLVE